jgi:MoaA/NifB/PqqE/SkfB family radical SAM enzyme
MCPRGQGKAMREKNDIDINFFKDIIEELQEYDPKIQLWNYGEPFFHKQITTLIRIIPKKFSDCSISTNGHFMTNELAKSIISSGITEVIFAIDGITEETYKKYRVNGSLETVLQNLKMFTDINTNKNIKVSVQFIAFKHNLHEIPLLGDFFAPYNVNNIKVKSAMLMTLNKKEDFKIAKKYLSFQYEGERYEINNSIVIPKGTFSNYCPVIENSFVITTDQKILPCCWDYEGEYEIKNKNDWIKIKNLINSDNFPEMCNKCPIRYNHTFSWDWDKVPSIKY